MKVINRNNLPVKMPIMNTVITVLAFDYWNAPQWLWGVMGIVCLGVWVYVFIRFKIEKPIDVINKSDTPVADPKNIGLMERLEVLRKEQARLQEERMRNVKKEGGY